MWTAKKLLRRMEVLSMLLTAKRQLSGIRNGKTLNRRILMRSRLIWVQPTNLAVSAICLGRMEVLTAESKTMLFM